MKQKKSKQAPLDRSTRLSRYRTAGAGAAILAGAVTTADASIVFINFNNQVFTDPSAGNGTSTFFTAGNAGNFDFNTDGTVDFRLRQRNSGSYTTSSGYTFTLNLAGFAAPATGNIDVIGALNGANAYPSRLAAGATIGPAGPLITLTNGQTGFLASVYGFAASKWVSASGPASGFVGVRFTAGGQNYFGWVGLSVAGQDAAVPYAITLSGIAYENVPNTAIIAGQTTGGAVPEPASLALLALGGIGLVAYRKMQAKKAA